MTSPRPLTAVLGKRLQPLTPARYAWLATASTIAALETWAVLHPEHEATLSHLTRTLCRTHTAGGRVTFAALWGGFAVWFAHHILRTRTDANT